MPLRPRRVTNNRSMSQKAATLSIILSLLTSSCSTLERHTGLIGGVAAVGAMVGGSLLMKKRKDDKEAIKHSAVIDFDNTGSALEFGGALLDEDSLVHVMHWPAKIGQRLSFPRKSGGNDGRAIVAMTDLGNDTRIITLDHPLDPSEHKIWEIGKPKKGAVTIARFKRKPIGTNIVEISDRVLTGAAESGALKSGDSGKAWIQRRNGKAVLVSVSSRGGYGIAPNLWSVREEIAKLVAN